MSIESGCRETGLARVVTVSLILSLRKLVIGLVDMILLVVLLAAAVMFRCMAVMQLPLEVDRHLSRCAVRFIFSMRILAVLGLSAFVRLTCSLFSVPWVCEIIVRDATFVGPLMMRILCRSIFCCLFVGYGRGWGCSCIWLRRFVYGL